MLSRLTFDTEGNPWVDEKLARWARHLSSAFEFTFLPAAFGASMATRGWRTRNTTGGWTNP